MRLDFTLAASPTARVGQRVPITLRLHNASDQPAQAHFLGRTIAFDIVVTAADGTIAWRRLGEGAGPAILQIRTLAPGEAMEWRDTWTPQAPGRYRVHGVLPSDGEPLTTAPADVVVSP